MKTNGKTKEFDAVKMMRDIRDKMDRGIAEMTFAEEKAYLKKLVEGKPAKQTVKSSTRRQPVPAK